MRWLGGRDAAEGRSGKNAAVRVGLTPQWTTVALRCGSVLSTRGILSVIFGEIVLNLNLSINSAAFKMTRWFVLLFGCLIIK